MLKCHWLSVSLNSVVFLISVFTYFLFFQKIPKILTGCVLSFFFNVLKLYFNITILTEICILVNRMQFNLSYIIWTKKLGTWFALEKKEKGFAVWFIFYLLQMYIKDLLSNAAEVNSMNLEKLNFGLSLKNNMYYTVKINKVGATKLCCNVSMPVHKVQ